jgi:phosphatidylglycerophosphatase A
MPKSDTCQNLRNKSIRLAVCFKKARACLSCAPVRQTRREVPRVTDEKRKSADWEHMHSHVIELLRSRGVLPEDMAEIVYQLQKPYHPNLSVEDCLSSVLHVLEKREVQHAIFTGIAMDSLAEQSALPAPLQSIMEQDEPLYGVDEVLALSITNVYGSIGLTNFGYLDKTKLGIIGKLNSDGESIHVFLDDLVAGVAASAAARIAHHHAAKSYEREIPMEGDLA